jgi:hypothetical protein
VCRHNAAVTNATVTKNCGIMICDGQLHHRLETEQLLQERDEEAITVRRGDVVSAEARRFCARQIGESGAAERA